MFARTRIHFQGENLRKSGMAAWFLTALLLFPGYALAQQQGFLENPLDFSSESGISAVTGFHCSAQEIAIQFDQYDPIIAASGTSRNDTTDYCGGNSNTGFSLLWNWNILGPGQHTVRALADGVEFAAVTITVHTFGQEFILGLNLQTDLLALGVGKEISLRWQESKQGFVIDNIEDADLTLDDIIAVISGSWTGYWHSPFGTGTIGMTFVEGFSGFPRLDQFNITGTGCADSGMAQQEMTNIEDPLINVDMFDGSSLTLEFFVTESFTTLGGVFWIEGGACADTDGMFYMFK